MGSAHKKRRYEKEAGFARILKDPAFFWKKESGPKKTGTSGPFGAAGKNCAQLYTFPMRLSAKEVTKTTAMTMAQIMVLAVLNSLCATTEPTAASQRVVPVLTSLL